MYIFDKTIFTGIFYVLKEFLALLIVFKATNRLLVKKDRKIPIIFLSLIILLTLGTMTINFIFFYVTNPIISIVLQVSTFFYLILILIFLYKESILKKLISAMLGSMLVGFIMYGMLGLNLLVLDKVYITFLPIAKIEEIPPFLIEFLLFNLAESFLSYILKKPIILYKKVEIKNNIFYIFLMIFSFYFPTSMMITVEMLAEYSDVDTFINKIFILVVVFFLIGGALQYFYSKNLRNKAISFKNLYAMQNQHYKDLEESIEKTKSLKNDINEHVKMIQILQEREADCLDFENEIIKKYDEINSIISTNNTIIDALLFSYAKLCKENKIVNNFQIKFSRDITALEYDIHSILNHLLEIAYAECNRIQKQSGKYISVEGYFVKNYLFLVMECSKSESLHNNSWFSNKRKMRKGIRKIKEVQNICNKHEGNFDSSEKEEVLKITVMLQVDN